MPYEMTPKEEAEYYLTIAEEIQEDPDYKRDNPDETPREYALYRIEMDIRYARRTRQYAWARHLERAKKWIERLSQEK